MAQFQKNRVRVGGSGFTIFTFQGSPVAFAQQVSHTSAAPVGPGAVPIHPMDEPYPSQVITPAAAGMGSLTLNLYELYYSKVWERLGVGDPKVAGSSADRGGGSGGFFHNANDIVDVFIKQAAANPADLSMVKIIRPPSLGGEGMGDPYWEVYRNCVVTNIVDGEEINIGTMEVIKQVTVAYTNVLRKGIEPLAYKLRDRALPRTS